MGLASIAKKTHWLGVALLFIASICMLFATISAPIMNHNALLHVSLPMGTSRHPASVSFGTYGYCVLNTGSNNNIDSCTKHHLGYSPARVMERINREDYSDMASGTSASLTRVMVLHPVVTGLAFIAFLLSLGSGIIGSLAGALVAAVSWVLTLIALACDFSLFGIVRHHVNEDGTGSHAYFGSAIWLVLASFVLLFFGMIIVLFTSFSVRREKKRDKAAQKDERYPAAAAAAPKKKRFGIF